MENVTLPRRARICARACVILILSVSILLLIAFAAPAGGKYAYADNNSQIGDGGGDISVDDKTDYPEVAAGPNGYKKIPYIGHIHGVDLLISFPQSYSRIYLAYEVASNNSDELSWAIKGNDLSDDGINYMLLSGAGDNHESFAENIFYRAEWSAPKAENGLLKLTLTVHANGELSVLVMSDSGDETLRFNKIVNSVDWNSPELKDCGSYRVSSAGGKYKLNAYASFSDNLKPLMESATSGIGYIAIIRTDLPITQGANPSDTAGYEIIKDYYRDGKGNISLPATVLPTYTLEFEISKDGYYYYYVMDRVGNTELGSLMEKDKKIIIEVDSRFTVSRNVNGKTEFVSVEGAMRDYGAKIEREKDKVNLDLYNSTMEAYSSLMLAFMAEDENRSQKYWNFVENVYKPFLKAVNEGADYRLEVINEDFMFGTITAVNLNSSTVKAQGGDDVKASIIVARFVNDLNPDIVAASDIKKATDIYRLNYKLTVNGELGTVPEEALVFNVEMPDSVKEIALVVKTPTGYTTKKLTVGVSWVRLDTTLNEAEYYLVTREESHSATDKLLPLWITLGVLGGAALVAAAVVVGVAAWKKKKKSA